MRASSSTPSAPSSIALTMPWNDFDRGDRLAELHVRDAGEELRLNVVLRVRLHLLEERESLFVLAVTILVATEQVVQLPVEIALIRVVELRDLLVVVLADALDDVGGLREVGRELREPEERLVEFEVVRLVGRSREKIPYAAWIELHAVERDREVVLRELLVSLVVAGLALADAIERERPPLPTSPRRRVASPSPRPRSSDRLAAAGPCPSAGWSRRSPACWSASGSRRARLLASGPASSASFRGAAPPNRGRSLRERATRTSC